MDCPRVVTEGQALIHERVSPPGAHVKVGVISGLGPHWVKISLGLRKVTAPERKSPRLRGTCVSRVATAFHSANCDPGLGAGHGQFCSE